MSYHFKYETFSFPCIHIIDVGHSFGIVLQFIPARSCVEKCVQTHSNVFEDCVFYEILQTFVLLRSTY